MKLYTLWLILAIEDLTFSWKHRVDLRVPKYLVIGWTKLAEIMGGDSQDISCVYDEARFWSWVFLNKKTKYWRFLYEKNVKVFLSSLIFFFENREKDFFSKFWDQFALSRQRFNQTSSNLFSIWFMNSWKQIKRQYL